MSLADRLVEARASREASPEVSSEAAKWDVSPDEMPIVPEPAAESDPFAPIGAEVSAPATSPHVENVDGKLASLRSLQETESSSPIYDQLVAEQSGLATEADPAASSVDQSASRIGNILRGSANLADSASETLTDTKEYAKTKLRNLGRAALRAARATRELGAGVRVLATQTARSGAEQVGAAAKRGAESAATKVKDSYNNAIDKGLESLDKGADYIGDKMIGMKEGVKERLVARKEAAQTRRQVRRERWSQRLTSVKETVKTGYDKSGNALMSGFAKLETGADVVGNKMVNAKDKVADKAERARSTAAAMRALGRAAIDARRA